MAQQATLLGLSPRAHILHTSPSEFGQIYVPAVNWLQLAGVLGIVLAFKTGPDIASAYGIAVTGTMMITTVLVLTLAVRGWRWPWLLVGPLFLLLLVVDGSLFSANMTKFVEGGWVPLIIATVLFIAMWTWYRGRNAVSQREHEQAVPIDTLLATIEPESLNRPQGTAIYLTTFADAASNSLMQNLRHNGVLHEHVVLLTVHLLEEPFVGPEDRLRVRELGSGIHRAMLCYGFMEKPDVAHDVAGLERLGIPVDPMHTSFFIGHNNVVSGEHPLLPSWQRRLFLMLSRFAASPTDFLGLPANRTVELGSRIEV
jgi:KUP system potassium uptake protein